ncbi:DUF4238 domain-containing protein [Gorillibacterium sp. sgz5001074]|uniref:DUF4238 domain-containing protein n=1 Tax=Gorillibacterium sp. sgz5001074 TaxID=3446695 RepID=UPI003F670824
MSELVKNQHYIPRSVLKHFSSGEMLYEYLVNGNKEPYKTNYRNSMTERFTYEHPELEQNRLEKHFQSLEDEFAPALVETIRLIELYETGQESIDVVKQHIERYINTIIIYYYRSGALLHEFSFGLNRKEVRVELLLDKISRAKYIQDLGETICKYYQFAIIKSEQGQFLISDQYLSTVALRIKSRFTNSSNRHMGMKDVMILVPISSYYYFVYYNGKKPDFIQPNRLNLLTSKEVQDINGVIINNSYNKCVGKDLNALLEAVPFFCWASPSSFFSGNGRGQYTGSTLKKEIFYYDKDKKAWDLFLNPLHEKIYHHLSRNDNCGCGSGQKFKNCCYEYYEEVKRIWRSIGPGMRLNQDVRVHPEAVVEKSIFSF